MAILNVFMGPCNFLWMIARELASNVSLLGITEQYKYSALMCCQQFYNSELGQITSG